MKPANISLRTLRKTRFPELYSKLLLGMPLNLSEKSGLLELAVLLINSKDDSTQKLGYRMVLFYSNLFKDYAPLYDLAINKGYIPVSKFIESKIVPKGRRETFFQAFQSAYNEAFRSDRIYLTEQQHDLWVDLKSGGEGISSAIIAPTSYGKSELILESLGSQNKNICILVPTKALIAQTKRRVINSKNYDISRKVITHPEMYRTQDKSVVAIVTQERLLRLLQKADGLKFDLVFVDEAHNLLEDDERSRLLATAIIMLEKRNQRACFTFLTPFLLHHKNLDVLHTNLNMRALRVDEYIKSERLYCYDFISSSSLGLELYDQFLDTFIPLDEEVYSDDVALILKKKMTKNIVYANRPISIERLARRIAERVEPIESDDVERASRALAEYVHKDYFLINCLRRGVVYHHGSVPDIVKLYLEHLFSNTKEIAFIATTSTLLEGVNIPAECLFLLDYKKGRSRLSPAQFKNLIGRVCRLKEIFDPNTGSLNLLEPHIYVVASSYISKKANIKSFLQKCMKVDRREIEVPENVLLSNSKLSSAGKIAERTNAEEHVENMQPGLIENRSIRRAKTQFGKACFQNSINEINILECESECQRIVDGLSRKVGPAGSADSVLSLIKDIFLPYVADENLQRLQEDPARAFYAMLLNWRVENLSFGEMIGRMLHYWKRQEGQDPLVFVGHKWGDTARNGSHSELWTDISKKTPAQRTNLAIVRIKDEQDYLDNQLFKLLEVLHDLGLIEGEFFEKIRFGTSDVDRIALMKNGFSAALARLLLTKYRESVRINHDTENVFVNPEVRERLIKNGENEILIFELGCNVGHAAG